MGAGGVQRAWKTLCRPPCSVLLIHGGCTAPTRGCQTSAPSSHASGNVAAQVAAGTRWRVGSMSTVARPRRRRLERGIASASLDTAAVLMALLLAVAAVPVCGRAEAGVGTGAGAFLGLTNELAAAPAGGGGGGDSGGSAPPLNLTAFEALSDPALTAPFHEEVATMWSALQFLCQTFDGRQLDGCDGILALAPPGTTGANATTIHADATGVRAGSNGDDGGDGDEDAATKGTTPLHAATLFRFLRAQPLGFSHMKVKVGADAREALAADTAGGQYLLRQELERKIFRLTMHLERLLVRRRALELHVEFCDKMIMTIDTYRDHIGPWLDRNASKVAAHLTTPDPTTTPEATTSAPAWPAAPPDPFGPTDGLAKALDDEYAAMVAALGAKGAAAQSAASRRGARQGVLGSGSVSEFDHSDRQAKLDLAHWRAQRAKHQAGIAAIDAEVKRVRARLEELHRMLARLGPYRKPPRYECIAYRRAAAAEMWMMGLAASFKARGILITFFPTIEKFWLQLVSAIYQTKATKWKRKKKEIKDKVVDGRLDFLCRTAVVASKEFCNQENYMAFEKSNLSNATWRVPRALCSKVAARTKKLKKLKPHKECHAMVEKQFETASQIVMGTLQSLKQIIEDFFKSIFAWIFLLIDADKFKRQARDLWIMAELLERPPKTENTTWHLITQQRMIATRLGQSVATIQLDMAREDLAAAESITTNVTFLRNYTEALRLATRNVENAERSAEDAVVEAAQFGPRDDPKSDDIPLTISPVDVFKARQLFNSEEPVVLGPRGELPEYTVGYNRQGVKCREPTAKTLDPYDCKRFIVGKRLDDLLKAVSDKANYMYDTAVQGYKNNQAAAKNLCDLAGIRDIRWPAPPLAPTDVENLANEFPDSDIRGAIKSK